MTEKATVQPKVLTVKVTAELNLSEAEYSALQKIATAYDCTIDDVISTIIHRGTDAELETALVPNIDDLRTRMEKEWKQVFAEQEALEQARRDGKLPNEKVLFTLEGEGARAYAEAAEEGRNFVRYQEDEKGGLARIQFLAEV